MTAPHPSLKARLITLRFVPGGPEPMTKGLGSFRPSTVVASVGITEAVKRAVRRSAEGSQSAWPAIPGGLAGAFRMGGLDERNAAENRLVSKLELGQVPAIPACRSIRNAPSPN